MFNGVEIGIVKSLSSGGGGTSEFSYPILTNFGVDFLPKKIENERINIELSIENEILFDKATLTIDYSGGWVSLYIEKDIDGYFVLSPMNFSTLPNRIYTLNIEFRDKRMIKYDSDLELTFES